MKLPVVLFQQMNTPTAVFTLTTTLLWYMLGVPVFICRSIASVGFNEMNAATELVFSTEATLSLSQNLLKGNLGF